MKILALIPARGGSKGLPGKNTKLLGGKPLIGYTIGQAAESKLLSRVIVSTDDEAIAQIAREFGAEVPFIRPSELATDTAASIAVVQHALAFFESKGEFFEGVCLLQPTSPFREKGFIDRAISQFISADFDGMVSVLPVPDEFNPHWVFEPQANGLLKLATGEKQIIKRRQDLPAAFFRDGSVYLTKTAVIKRGSFYGDKLGYIQSNPDFYVNIDTAADWQKAEGLLPQILPGL